MKIREESNDEGKIFSKIYSIIFIWLFLETDYTEDINKNDDSMDSDYNTKRKRKVWINQNLKIFSNNLLIK